MGGTVSGRTAKSVQPQIPQQPQTGSMGAAEMFMAQQMMMMQNPQYRETMAMQFAQNPELYQQYQMQMAQYQQAMMMAQQGGMMPPGGPILQPQGGPALQPASPGLDGGTLEQVVVKENQ